LSLEEAMREKPRSIAHLESIREMYLDMINRADEKKLEELLALFTSKELEAMVHESLLREAQPRFPKIISDELMATKSRMVMFWRGLKEEVERRLGL
jgi:hypothetical protein